LDPTDAELLAAFASARDEVAFAELVRRHGRLVRETARRMVGDPSTAEDVFQATFLLLARKANAVSWGPTIGPWLYQAAWRIGARLRPTTTPPAGHRWLYQAAWRIGARARARAARRPLSPISPDVPAPASDPAAGLAWAEVRAALDDALASLPDRLRAPLVLCYLQGLTQDEAAAALGLPPATVKGRVTRGRERIRRLLGRRDLSLPAALAGLLVAGPAVTTGVAAATARAATAFRFAGVSPAGARALLSGAPGGAKLGAVLLGLALACAAVAAGATRFRAAPPPASPAAARAPRGPAADALGDPLPAGAVARLGTRRLYGFYSPTWATFSPDGKKVAARGFFGITVWDAATGRMVLERADYNVVADAAGWRADGTGVAVVRLADGSLFVSAFTDPHEKRPNPPPFFPRVIPNPHISHLALSPTRPGSRSCGTPKGTSSPSTSCPPRRAGLWRS
jgi:RNA polymerase sigma factor (sigma-70 family)